jgi:4-amino-4-deoxy-L-arabinose transferase-like glycosyltransferase
MDLASIGAEIFGILFMLAAIVISRTENLITGTAVLFLSGFLAGIILYRREWEVPIIVVCIAFLVGLILGSPMPIINVIVIFSIGIVLANFLCKKKIVD